MGAPVRREDVVWGDGRWVSSQARRVAEGSMIVKGWAAVLRLVVGEGVLAG